MAWRIDAQVIRGEVDNRVRGRIVGRFWFLGRKEPVELDLQGNGSRDLAGRCLEFVNPSPKAGLDPMFAVRQAGVVGQFTASRKVRVPEISPEEMSVYYRQKKPFPWHWGNSVYFEWYSLANGRVVIESADYQLTVAEDTTWEMSAQEEEVQQQINTEAIKRFFEQRGYLSGSSKSFRIISSDQEEPADSLLPAEENEEVFNSDEPLTEEEADELIADSDRLTDRLMAKLDEAGENADLDAILEEELQRRREEAESTDPLTPEEEAERAAWLDEMNRAAEEIANDPAFKADLERKHPLSERGRALSLRVMTDVDGGGWVPESGKGEHPVVDLVRSVTKAGGKLAGALDGRDWPPLIDECGLCIAWLKRARGFLSDAAVAGDFCRGQGLIPTQELELILQEISGLQAEVDAVIEELRERLARGFD